MNDLNSMLPPYTWTAIYNDGTMLHQRDPDTGTESSSEHIERDKLTAVVFHGLYGPLCVFHVAPNETFFYRRRHEQSSAISADPNADYVRECQTGHILGCWRKGLDTMGNEIDVQRAIFIGQPAHGMPIVESYGEPIAGHNWHYSIVPVEAELAHYSQEPALPDQS